jgi:peptidyl-prolyl cis-trans isomerase C
MKIAYLPAVLAAILAATSVQAADAPKAASAPAAPPAAAAPPAEAADVRLVTVNGVPYSLDLFRIFYLERLQQTQAQDTPEAQQQSFNEFINLAVTAQQAPIRKLSERHDVQLGLELQKLKLLSSVALQAMAMDIQPTEEELKKAYDEVVKEAKQTQYKARHILVKEEAEAKKLIAELDKKADFTELAKKHSIGPAGKNGGDLDWFSAGQMVKPFSDATAALQKGSYTKTPVQTQFGWHVILLEDIRTAEPPSFEDAKPQLVAAIQRNKIGEAIVELRKTTTLELNEDVIKLKEDPAKGEAEKAAPAKAEPAKK